MFFFRRKSRERHEPVLESQTAQIDTVQDDPAIPAGSASPPVAPRATAPAVERRIADPAAGRREDVKWPRSRALEKPPVAQAPRKRMARVPRTAVAAVAFVLVPSAVIAGRTKIVEYYSPAARVFAAMGLPVNLRGLELRDVTSKVLTEDGAKVLTVEGQIANLRRRSVAVPDVRISMRAANGSELYSWIAPSPKKRIGEGESVHFRARLAAPPDGGESVTVRFAAARTSH